MNNGIVCKVWNIQGNTLAKSAATQLEDSIGYVLNDEKTDCQLELQGKNINDPMAQLGRECKYVANDVKTMAGAYVGGVNIVSDQMKNAVAEMMDVKNFYGKTDGRAALHGIISLPETESDVTNASALMQLCENVMKEVFPNHQSIFAVHTNTENLHIHFIVNSVGLDGRKIHQNDKFMKEVLHPCVNKYAKQYGFAQNEKWNKEYDATHSSYAKLKIQLRDAIDAAIENADDFMQFRKNLEKAGYGVNVGKYISIKSEDMDKAVRTYQLGNNYTKDAIVERIATRKNAFEKLKVNDYVPDNQKEKIFEPTILKMQRYKDMEPEQKKYIIKQLRLGRNPWREHQQMSWQLNNIADQINLQNRVFSYVNFYSSDNSISGSLAAILDAKRKVGAEKKIIIAQKRKYKPILDIYEEMKKIQRKAYLYEHENISEYRAEFEQYRELTRRLRNGYNKDIVEVANFLDECTERLLYAHAQVNELSLEYREIKQYAKERGDRVITSDAFVNVMGIYDTRKDEKNNIFEADAFYIVSDSSDAIIRVIKTPTINEHGRIIEQYELTVLTKNGEVLETINSDSGIKDFSQSVRELEGKYNLKKCQRFTNVSLAREYVEATAKQNDSVTANNYSDVKQDKPLSKDTASFTQAVNHCNTQKGMCVLVDTEMSAFIAIASLDENNIKITVFDENHRIKESVEIPSISERTSEGYNKMMYLQKKYGFSDRIVTFEDMNKANEYVRTTDSDYTNNRRDEWRKTQ